MAFLGGLWQLPPNIFKPLIGLVLAFSAMVLIIRICRNTPVTRQSVVQKQAPPPLSIAILLGAPGLLGGTDRYRWRDLPLPLLLLMNWADSRRTAATSIVFVLVNSLAGLGGVFSDMPELPSELPFYVLAATSGGLLGSAGCSKVAWQRHQAASGSGPTDSGLQDDARCQRRRGSTCIRGRHQPVSIRHFVAESIQLPAELPNQILGLRIVVVTTIWHSVECQP